PDAAWPGPRHGPGGPSERGGGGAVAAGRPGAQRAEGGAVPRPGAAEGDGPRDVDGLLHPEPVAEADEPRVRDADRHDQASAARGAEPAAQAAGGRDAPAQAAQPGAGRRLSCDEGRGTESAVQAAAAVP